MKKILYVVTEDWYFWSHRKMLAECTMKSGYEVIVATKPGLYAEKIASIGIEVVPIVIARTIASPVKEIRSILALIDIYKKINPDLVHHISLKPILIGSIAAWIAGVPRIINAYTGLGYIFISSSWTSVLFRKAIVPFLSMLFDRKQFYSIVQNKEDETLLENEGLIKPEKYSLIPGSGVDTKEFKYTPERYTDTPIVMFASRLLIDKGIYEFIEACKKLKIRGVCARYVVVGDVDIDNPSSISKSEIKMWDENQIVEWWGYRDDMYEVISKSNIVCLPSYREGLPKILLEAASVGRAIVTTNVPGCKDVVKSSENGILVSPKRSGALAEAINKLINSTELRITMGKNGHDRVCKIFDINKINKHTIDLYNNAFNKKQE